MSASFVGLLVHSREAAKRQARREKRMCLVQGRCAGRTPSCCSVQNGAPLGRAWQGWSGAAVESKGDRQNQNYFPDHSMAKDAAKLAPLSSYRPSFSKLLSLGFCPPHYQYSIFFFSSPCVSFLASLVSHSLVRYSHSAACLSSLSCLMDLALISLMSLPAILHP